MFRFCLIPSCMICLMSTLPAQDGNRTTPSTKRVPNELLLAPLDSSLEPSVPIVPAQALIPYTLQQPRHYVQLGLRDDREESDYDLPNRNRETPQGKPVGRYCQNGFERAGCPQLWRSIADYSVQRKHTIGYIGGGSPWHVFGERRCVDEGTFGMDTTSHWLSRKLWLKWNHGQRYQGGAGAYATDGPHVLKH